MGRRRGGGLAGSAAGRPGTPAAAVPGFCGQSVFGRAGRAKYAAAAAGIGGEVSLERDPLRLERRIGRGQKGEGEPTGGARAADGEGGHGEAAGHLQEGEPGIEALEAFAFDGPPDHGERGVARDQGGQMRGAAGAGDDDAQAAPLGGLGVAGQVVRGVRWAEPPGLRTARRSRRRRRRRPRGWASRSRGP